MKLNRTYTLPLDASERKALKGLAHHLDPVVIIGDAGLSDSVLAEISRALAVHELIKIRVFGDDRAARDQYLTAICEKTGCAPVQRIGKLLVVYLPRPPKEVSAKGPHVPKKLAASGATAPRPVRTGTKSPGKAGRATAARSASSPARPAASGAKRRAPIAKSSWARPIAQSPGRSASSAGTRSGPRAAGAAGTRSGTRPPRSAAGGVRTGVTRRAPKKS
jgi:RNA-binding protein